MLWKCIPYFTPVYQLTNTRITGKAGTASGPSGVDSHKVSASDCAGRSHCRRGAGCDGAGGAATVEVGDDCFSSGDNGGVSIMIWAAVASDDVGP